MNHWRTAAVLGATATILLVVAAGSLLTSAPVRNAVRSQLGDWDMRVLHGALHRQRAREHLPSPDLRVPPAPTGAYEWLGTEPLLAIAHGLGPQLYAGQNSPATLQEGLRRGFRAFEVDLVLTREGRLVCYHGDVGERLDALAYAGYLARTRALGIEPCELRDLIAVAHDHDDVRFVLDVKNRFGDAYRMARTAIGDPALGRRFIPQIYFFEQLEPFRREPFFGGEIYTSYAGTLTTEQILETARRLHVRAVTLTLERFRAIAGHVPPGTAVLVHPVDDPFQAAELRRAGARGIFTSYLTSQSVPELFAPWTEGCQPPRVFACEPPPAPPSTRRSSSMPSAAPSRR